MSRKFRTHPLQHIFSQYIYSVIGRNLNSWVGGNSFTQNFHLRIENLLKWISNLSPRNDLLEDDLSAIISLASDRAASSSGSTCLSKSSGSLKPIASFLRLSSSSFLIRSNFSSLRYFNLTREPASSSKSIALSGKKRSAIYCSPIWAADSRASSLYSKWWCFS